MKSVVSSIPLNSDQIQSYFVIHIFSVTMGFVKQGLVVQELCGMFN